MTKNQAQYLASQPFAAVRNFSTGVSVGWEGYGMYLCDTDNNEYYFTDFEAACDWAADHGYSNVYEGFV